MPSISDLQFGFDSNGADHYPEDLKSIVLTEAAEKLDDVAAIIAACESHWEGQARSDFLENLEKDKKHVQKQFKELYTVLEGEIQQIEQAMANKDKELIN